ncbi:MAG: DUF2889 domain-containing protein [Alphaproteobacteria bacterium]|nr:DUF2889 domain-containing protein [Alphaproteobacteria bacterium]
MAFLSTDPDREELYFRHIDYIGYRRTDGLWDIEGHFRDRRTVDCPCIDRGGMIQAGETFHEMLLTMTIDDDMVIRGLTVKIEKHPYKQCPAAEAVFKNVEGLQIAAGFSKELRRRVPAKLACTHLFSLLIGAAGAAFQTVAQVRMMKYCRGVRPDPLDTCLAWDSSGEMVKREWPDFYQPKEASSEEEK